MIAIHAVAQLTAKTSSTAESNWVSLTLTQPDGDISTEVTIYFATRNRGFEEEHRFAVALAEAINGLKPMDIGSWGSQEEPHSGPTAPLGPTVVDEDEIIIP